MEFKDEEVLRAMIDKNADHYLEKFKQIEQGEKVKFQWSALWLGPLFVLYRKCNEIFIRYYAVPYILVVILLVLEWVGIGLMGSTMGLNVLFIIPFVVLLMVIANIWFLAAGILLGKNFPKLYWKHLIALREKEQIDDVEHNKATIKQFATTDIRIPIAFSVGAMVIMMFFSTIIPSALLEKSLVIEPETVASGDVSLINSSLDEDVTQKAGGLLDISTDELYSEMLNQVWVNEKTGDTIYIETGGISATDGYVYENGVYIGEYSAYGVYGSEAPNGIISEGAFQLELWPDAQPDISYLYEIEAIGSEELEFYDMVTGVFNQYICADENVNVTVENWSSQAAAQEMTLEEAREYLIQCMYEVYPDFDAREDFAYSLQNEDEYCYSFQVLVKNAQTTSNNMGFYSVFKNSGEVCDDIFGNLIWTPYDGLIR